MLNKLQQRRSNVPRSLVQYAGYKLLTVRMRPSGDCSLWFHRGCASVPPDLYKALSNSDEPFVCLPCTSSLQKQQITATVNALKELEDALKFRETCSTLAGEIATLREALDRLQKEVKSSSDLCRSIHFHCWIIDCIRTVCNSCFLWYSAREGTQ